MGVDCYLVSHEKKEKYHLGRGFWNEHGSDVDHDDLKRLAENVLTNRGAGISESRRFANELIEWANARGKVYVISDAQDEYDEKGRDYEETGSVMERPQLTKDDIRHTLRDYAREIKDKLGAVCVDIRAVVEEVDDEDAECRWQIGAVVGDTENGTGYKLVAVKRYNED